MLVAKTTAQYDAFDPPCRHDETSNHYGRRSTSRKLYYLWSAAPSMIVMEHWTALHVARTMELPASLVLRRVFVEVAKAEAGGWLAA